MVSLTQLKKREEASMDRSGLSFGRRQALGDEKFVIFINELLRKGHANLAGPDWDIAWVS